jgi:hypothetical protein
MSVETAMSYIVDVCVSSNVSLDKSVPNEYNLTPTIPYIVPVRVHTLIRPTVPLDTVFAVVRALVLRLYVYILLVPLENTYRPDVIMPPEEVGGVDPKDNESVAPAVSNDGNWCL